MRSLCIVLFLLIIAVSPCFSADPVNTSWYFTADDMYDHGFMHMLMRNPGGGVRLFDMELIQNDAPGAGNSEKGVWLDTIWGENYARKVLFLDDNRAQKAYLIAYNNQQGKYPLNFSVNGKESQIVKWNTPSYYMSYIWAEFPAEWLKKGKNTIELYCPEAASEKEGWRLYLARADEFENGGGDPVDVGKTSFKSTNSGETWKQSPFGPLGKERAEYSVRISLDRYLKTGWLASPVVDLWKESSDQFIARQHTATKLQVTLKSDVPEGTDVEFYIRKGTNPSPHSQEWDPYELIGNGPEVTFEADIRFNRRFIQLRAVLKTENPLISPIIREASIKAELKEPYPIPIHENYRVLSLDNPEIKYSSIDWEWEKWDRPEFTELKVRESLDTVIEGSRSQFEAQVKLLDYASNRWRWHSPIPEYPGWDALSISKRINKNGGGGMCIQHNNFLGGSCMVYGWQARLVNVDGHEICEVWSDEFGKWVYIDASYNHYLVDKETGEPLSFLGIHNKYIATFFKDTPIDWTDNDGLLFKKTKFDVTENEVYVRRGSLIHHDKKNLSGFASGSFARMVPRNNWYAKPYPRPLSHGSSVWPWNGYINWYDEQTPRRRQYSWFTDRPRDMWPDLNTVHIHASCGESNDRLFLQFETYTPNLSHYEIDVNNKGWKKCGEYMTWFFASGRNTLRVRSVSKLGNAGKPSAVTINYYDVR
ncbi:hypothetical protein ACFL47_03190 [Candidatus Latescibacterota bacterium]